MWLAEEFFALQMDGKKIHSLPGATFGEIELPDENYLVHRSAPYTDKNGKELYEGDIVKIDGMHYTFVVRLKRYKDCEHEDHYGFCFEDASYEHFNVSILYRMNFIIIGNEAENPELLPCQKTG